MLVWVGRFLMKDFQPFVFSYALADFPFFQITSDYLNLCFPWSSGETTTNLEGTTLLQLPDQALPSILFI